MKPKQTKQDLLTFVKDLGIKASHGQLQKLIKLFDDEAGKSKQQKESKLKEISLRLDVSLIDPNYEDVIEI